MESFLCVSSNISYTNAVVMSCSVIQQYCIKYKECSLWCLKSNTQTEEELNYIPTNDNDKLSQLLHSVPDKCHQRRRTLSAAPFFSSSLDYCCIILFIFLHCAWQGMWCGHSTSFLPHTSNTALFLFWGLNQQTNLFVVTHHRCPLFDWYLMDTSFTYDITGGDDNFWTSW